MRDQLLDLYVRFLLPSRDELALRTLDRSQPLSGFEHWMLSVHDWVLDKLDEPGPAPLPDDVRKIMDDVVSSERHRG